MSEDEEIYNIIKESLEIERWAEKSDLTYSFLDDREMEEITENILLQLDKHKYKIVKKE